MPDASKNKQMEDILKKYQDKLEKNLNIKKNPNSDAVKSMEYSSFKKQYLPKELSLYEKLCAKSEEILKLKPGEKTEKELNEAIETCHLSVTPSGVTSFAMLVLVSVVMFGFFVSLAIGTYNANTAVLSENETAPLPIDFVFVLFFMIAATSIYIPLSELPKYIADNWRIKASNQMVLSIFYVVTYMRHTSNLELAIDFAAEHLAPPLSLDFKKIVWDVQTEKYPSIKEGLDLYLEKWKRTNLEFVEAFHLIESSLYEGDEGRRVSMLDKSLNVMLEETYEKMLHYAQDLKSPITMLHMMGIILPILGLVILPLVVSFIPQIKWYHIAIIYNVTLPIGIYFLGHQILSQRPSGYGDTDVTEFDPEAKKLQNFIIKSGDKEQIFTPMQVAVTIALIFCLIGFSPLIIHAVTPNFEYAFDIDTMNGRVFDMSDPNSKSMISQDYEYVFLEYRCPSKEPECAESKKQGPYGVGAMILGFFTSIGLGISISAYYSIKSSKLVEIRNKSRTLEKEFAPALFQLGNRLGDGIPAELAFTKVASVMEGSVSGSFFKLVELNIRKLGVDVERAIFDPKYGAIISYPSALIKSSMKVLSQSIKKGPRIAASAMVNVSNYVKEIHKVDERLKDLMSDVISDMKSQISFLTPAISGIVIGITSMILAIVNKLTDLMGSNKGQGGLGASLTSMFSNGIPGYFFQLIIGLYVVEITVVLSILANGIENGVDRLNEEDMIAKNTAKGAIMYALIGLVVVLLFTTIAGKVAGTLTN